MTLETIANSERTLNAHRALQQLDYSAVDARFSGDYAGSVPAVRDETLKFLALAATAGEPVTPSQTIDLYWHDLILHTAVYDAACQKIGGFVHHHPSEQPERDTYNKTLALYTTVFGAPNPALWPKAAAGDCQASCNAGSCSGSCSSYCTGGSCQASCRT